MIAKVKEDHDRRERATKSLGKFILATNQLDSEEMTSENMLDVYKGQTVSVERGFRFLKDPLFFTPGLFLHKPVILKNPTTIEYKVLNLKPMHQRIIRLLGPHVERCYFFHL